MTSKLSQHQLLIQDENLNINHKKPMVGEKGKSNKTTIRKALGDITNKPTVQRELSAQTKNKPKEEVDIAEEKFLHDHNKCIEAQKAAKELCFLDTVLCGYDSMSFGSLESSPAKVDDADSNCCYPEPEELPMSEFSDWLNSSSQWDPPHWDSPPSSPLLWEFEPVEFKLKAVRPTKHFRAARIWGRFRTIKVKCRQSGKHYPT